MKKPKPASLSSSLLARHGEARPDVSSVQAFSIEGSPGRESLGAAGATEMPAERLAPDETQRAAGNGATGSADMALADSPTKWTRRAAQETSDRSRADPDREAQAYSLGDGTLRARGFLFVIAVAVLGSALGLWLGRTERSPATASPAVAAIPQPEPGAQAPAPEAQAAAPQAEAAAPEKPAALPEPVGNVIVSLLEPAAPRPRRGTAAPVPKAEEPAGPATQPEPTIGALATAAPPTHAYTVQLLSARSEAAAAKAWLELSQQHATLLGALSHEIAPAEIPGRGKHFRLRAGAFIAAREAEALCASLKSQGQDCLAVKR